MKKELKQYIKNVEKHNELVTKLEDVKYNAKLLDDTMFFATCLMKRQIDLMIVVHGQ